MDLNLGSQEDKTSYEFFSGKGGVGKTTLSTARALFLAGQGNKVLVVSTDPAHSISDCLEMEVGSEETEVAENLFAVEIDPSDASDELEEKLSDKGEAMEDMPLMDTGLGSLASSTPGSDEMVAFSRFMEYMHRDDYDYVIFDTAPTGHTLKFLSLPDVMESWVGKILSLKQKMSQFTDMFKGVMPFAGEEEEQESGFEELKEMKEDIKEAREIMQDSERTKFWMVLIPEEMSLYEGERMMQDLDEYGIPCENLIVNKMIPPSENCDFCSAKRRKQLEVLDSIKEIFEDKDIRSLQLLEEELKGQDLLRDVSKDLYQE